VRVSGSTAVVEAAAARAQGMAERGCTRASRPTKRRCEERADSGAFVSAPLSSFEVRATSGSDGPGSLAFEGMASVYEPADHGLEGHVCRGYQMWDWYGVYTEYVHLGAGTASLANPQLDVPFVTDHRSLQRLARTNNDASPLYLTEINEGDTPGLAVEAPTLSLSNPFVAQVEYGLTTKLLDEMSFRFMITGGSWSDDYTEYNIHAYDIHRGDVSIVGYGANPHTAGSGLRAALDPAAAVAALEALGDDELRSLAVRRGLLPAGEQADPLAARRAALHRFLDVRGVAR
jgi:hypothetical protein